MPYSTNPDWGIGAYGSTNGGEDSDTGGDPQPGDAGYEEFMWGSQYDWGGGQSNYQSQGQVPTYINQNGQMTTNPNNLGSWMQLNPDWIINQQNPNGYNIWDGTGNTNLPEWIRFAEQNPNWNQQSGWVDPRNNQQGGNGMNQLPTGTNYPVPSPATDSFNGPLMFGDFQSMSMLPYAPQNYDETIQKLFGQLGSATDPEEINARTQSLMALSNLPIQQYFQGAYPEVMGQLSGMYNQQQGRLQNTPVMTNGTQIQGAPQVPNQMNQAIQNTQNLNSDIYQSQRPNVGSFNQYNQGYQGAQNTANQMNADISDAQYTDIGNNLSNVQTSVQGANTQQLNDTRNNLSTGDVGRSFTPQVEQGVRNLSNFQAPVAPGSYQQQAINQLQNTQALSLPQGLQYEDAIDAGLANVADAGNRLVNSGNMTYEQAKQAIVADTEEAFAEQARQLESSLAASGMSNSTMANEQRNRLADQKARALANANLQAMQIIGGEQRSDLSSAQSALGALQNAQLQQGQFNAQNQLAGSQDSQSRANLLSNMLGNRFSEDVAGEQLAMQGNAESRANLGMQAGIADQYFNQAMQNRGLNLEQLSMLDQLANNELSRNVTQAGFGNQANLDQAQTRLAMQNARIQQALAEGQITSDQANTLMNIANSQVNAEQAGRSFDLATDQQGFQQALAEAGLKREDIDRLAQLAQTQYGMDMSNAGFNASENQRGQENYMNTVLQNENIYNNRYNQTQQPLTQLLSALSGVNVAPNALNNLQMPQRGPSTGEVAGQFLGSTIANLLPIPFMPRG